MAYIEATPAVLRYLGYVALVDFVCSETVGGVLIEAWNSSDPQPTEQEIADNELPAAKADKTAAINAEAERVILAKWPYWAQHDCNNGVYPPDVSDTYKQDVVDVINAADGGTAQVDTATTVEQVEAVTVTWPVLGDTPVDKFDQASYDSRTQQLEEVRNSVGTMQTIIDNADSANANQMRQFIKQLAELNKSIIQSLAGG